MRSSRSVCLLCRRNFLAANARQAATQWQNRSNSTISSRDATRTNDQAPGRATIKSEDGKDVASIENSSGRKQYQHEPPPRKTQNNNSSRLPERRTRNDTRVNALFQEILKVKSEDASSSVTKPEGHSADLTLYEDLAKLEDLITQNTSAYPAYKYLKNDIYPVARTPGTHIPQIFKTTVLRLLKNVSAEKTASLTSMHLPTVAELCQVYADIGALKGQQWAALVDKLVKYLCELSTSPADYPSIESYETNMTTRDMLLTDLTECWKVLSAPKTVYVKQSEDDTSRGGFWLPRLDRYSLKNYSKQGKFDSAIAMLFPHYAPNSLGPHVASLAIATYALLTDQAKSSNMSRENAGPFLQALSQIITVVRIPESQLRKAIRTTSPTLETYVMSRWPDIINMLKKRLEGASEVRTKRIHENNDAYAQNSSVVQISKQVDEALRSRNTGEALRLWSIFRGQHSDVFEEKKIFLRDNPEMFNLFLYTFLALNQSHQMIAVWQTMQFFGVPITIKTWNSMLNGCKKARNATAVRNIWSKLVHSGMPLDEAVWTARVSGLIESGEPQEGIQALEEMARLWKKGAQGAVQLTIAPINAALVGLIRLNSLPAAQQLLAWAGRQGIEPDVFTFNTLLRPLVRGGRQAEVEKVFGMMRDMGIQADTATFTIILDETLGKLGDLPEDEQIRVVQRVFTEMEAAGLQTNMQTYGKMIYILLQSGDHTQEAVKVVLAHIRSRGLELSSHIYTDLITHYFSRTPPDLEAVESLISRHQLHEKTNIDRVFWERVIEGYSRVGDTDSALQLCRRISATGATVRVDSQTQLLRALIHKGELYEARKLVEDTYQRVKESHPELEEGNQGQRLWKHRFWHLAANHGLIPTTAAAGTFGPSGIRYPD